MAAENKPNRNAQPKPGEDQANTASADTASTSGNWGDAEKLLARAQKEATSLLERAQKEAAALLARAQGAIGDGVSKTVKAAKDNPKIAAGIAAGAAATIAGGAYAATKLKSGSKGTTKPQGSTQAKPATRKPAARKTSPKKP